MKVYRLKVMIRTFVFVLAFLELSSVMAAPGDTTWVTVFKDMKLDHHGNYDTTVSFPQGKRYRKIRMHYILGRYTCGGAQYCGSWDYTTKIYALPAALDTVEIARVITPYATNWHQTNKSHDYIVEVTDYANALEGNTHMRFIYDGYSWGFTLGLRFELIEGVPPMDPLAVENIYDGYFAYGNASNPIENHLSQQTLKYASPKAFIKNSISGHGIDNQGCSEFCSKYYQVLIDNKLLEQKQIWRDNCGFNHIYPQTGTWVFDRSNWCPGDVVWPIYHDINQLTTSNTNFTADINLQPYVNANPSGGYNFVSQLIQYSDFNHDNDVSIEDILAPSEDPNYLRYNPACASPIIRVRNTGSEKVQSIEFEYGLSGRALTSYTWTGNLAPLATTDITLAASMSIMAHSVAAQFEVKILEVNEKNDEYADNNMYYSMTRPVKKMPSDIVVKLGTNGSTTFPSGNNETGWKLLNPYGMVIAERMDAASNSVYNDTVKNLLSGCYKFVVSDAGCDGFQWWYYQNYNPNPGNGTLRLDDASGSLITYFNGDIGCGYTEYYYVGDFPAPPGLPNLASLHQEELSESFELYPNPAHENVLVKVNLPSAEKVLCRIRDINGRLLQTTTIGRVDLHYQQLSLQGLAPGIYMVEIELVGKPLVTKKLLVY